MLEAGSLSAGHGRALLGAARSGEAGEGSSCEEAFRCARRSAWRSSRREPRPKVERKAAAKNADIVALEKELSELLGMKVELRDEGEGRGA